MYHQKNRLDPRLIFFRETIPFISDIDPICTVRKKPELTYLNFELITVRRLKLYMKNQCTAIRFVSISAKFGFAPSQPEWDTC
jgi:hypothetical protein